MLFLRSFRMNIYREHIFYDGRFTSICRRMTDTRRVFTTRIIVVKKKNKQTKKKTVLSFLRYVISLLPCPHKSLSTSLMGVFLSFKFIYRHVFSPNTFRCQNLLFTKPVMTRIRYASEHNVSISVRFLS